MTCVLFVMMCGYCAFGCLFVYLFIYIFIYLFITYYSLGVLKMQPRN